MALSFPTMMTDAFAGTVIVDAMANAVPVFVALWNRATVTSQAFVPSTFATMIESTSNTFPLDAALVISCVAVVAVSESCALFARTVVAVARFGFAIAFS